MPRRIAQARVRRIVYIDRKFEDEPFMLEKLKEIEEKYSEIERRMTMPEVYTDVAAYAKLAKDQKELTPVVETYRR